MTNLYKTLPSGAVFITQREGSWSFLPKFDYTTSRTTLIKVGGMYRGDKLMMIFRDAVQVEEFLEADEPGLGVYQKYVRLVRGHGSLLACTIEELYRSLGEKVPRIDPLEGLWWQPFGGRPMPAYLDMFSVTYSQLKLEATCGWPFMNLMGSANEIFRMERMLSFCRAIDDAANGRHQSLLDPIETRVAVHEGGNDLMLEGLDGSFLVVRPEGQLPLFGRSDLFRERRADEYSPFAPAVAYAMPEIHNQRGRVVLVKPKPEHYEMPLDVAAAARGGMIV